MNELPTFTVVDERKQFVPLRLQDSSGAISTEQCVFWTEPQDAKRALLQARDQRAEGTGLDVAAFPLGNAFALAEGWAEAEGKAPFRLMASSETIEQLRPLLTRQLEQQQLALDRPFPLFMCEELTSDKVMPVFLSRTDMVDTWEQALKAARKTAPPPSKVSVMDLRILVKHMQQPSGEDWSTVRFVGIQRAFDLANQGCVVGSADEEPPPLTSEPTAEAQPVGSAELGGAAAEPSKKGGKGKSKGKKR